MKKRRAPLTLAMPAAAGAAFAVGGAMIWAVCAG